MTNKLGNGSFFLVLGDFNIYASTESAYVKLKQVDAASDGHFIDPISMTGTWNQAAYAPYHTQSPRVRQFGGGATGGLDDRFDMILYSRAVSEAGGISFVSGSTTAVGNDGNHYNDSINKMPNASVSQSVAQALHDASDHLPVYATFSFESALPVQLTSFFVSAGGFNALLRWTTASETNNYGFDVERRNIGAGEQANWMRVGFVNGGGTTTSPREYAHVDEGLAPGRYAYRLKQIDFGGTFAFSYNAEAEIGLAPKELILGSNYPNPFNPSTTIDFTLAVPGKATVQVFNMLGQEVARLFDEQAEAGRIYQVKFDGSRMPSGVYFYTLSQGNQKLLKKLVLMK